MPTTALHIAADSSTAKALLKLKIDPSIRDENNHTCIKTTQGKVTNLGVICEMIKLGGDIMELDQYTLKSLHRYSYSPEVVFKLIENDLIKPLPNDYFIAYLMNDYNYLKIIVEKGIAMDYHKYDINEHTVTFTKKERKDFIWCSLVNNIVLNTNLLEFMDHHDPHELIKICQRYKKRHPQFKNAQFILSHALLTVNKTKTAVEIFDTYSPITSYRMRNDFN